MSFTENAIKGEMQYKHMVNMRATAETMTIGQWYEFDHEHYHQWFMFGRSKTKHAYTVEVKQRDRKTYVRKIPCLKPKGK